MSIILLMVHICIMKLILTDLTKSFLPLKKDALEITPENWQRL